MTEGKEGKAGVKAVAVHHVSINVSDVDRALAFYVDGLGLTQRADRPDFGVPGAWLDAGDQQLHLVQVPVPPAMGQHFALLFDPERLNSVVTVLRSRGLEVSDPSQAAPGHLQAFVSDPDGNTVELHEVVSS